MKQPDAKVLAERIGYTYKNEQLLEQALTFARERYSACYLETFENMTAARASYLHQIIDYRYGEKLQTVITTNAKNVAELCAWDGEAYIMPIVSRLLGHGTWVTITNAPDRRRNDGK